MNFYHSHAVRYQVTLNIGTNLVQTNRCKYFEKTNERETTFFICEKFPHSAIVRLKASKSDRKFSSLKNTIIQNAIPNS